MKRLLFIFLIIQALGSFSQKGNYYITNFTPATYGASDQNWCITQDSLGRLFVANLNGVLFYDGIYWKVITIKDNKECVSLAKSKAGVIYAGGNNEFGYISLTESGTYKYHSLSEALPQKEIDFGNVWAIHSIGDNVFFCSNERILWYKENKFIKSFTPTGEKFHTFFNVDNTLLVREQGVGLLFFRDGALHKILGSGELSDVRVYSILPLGDNYYWLCSRNGMFSLYFNINKPEISNLAKVKSPIDNWMTDNNVYCGAKLGENLFAIGSLKKGVILIDKNYNIINTISYDKGLQDDAVYYIFRDQSGNVILALNKGISYVQTNVPVTILGKHNGLNSTIESIGKINNTLYVATDKGIEKFNNELNIFEHTEISEQSWDIKVIDNEMFIGTRSGVFKLEKNGFYQFPEVEDIIYKIFVHPKNSKYIFLASDERLLYMKRENKNLKLIKAFDYALRVKSYTFDSKNNCIFFGTESENVYVFDLNKPDTLNTISIVGKEKTTQVDVSNCNNSIIFSTDHGIYKPIGYPNIKIERDPKFDIPGLRNVIFYYTITMQDEVWVVSAFVSDIFNIKEFPVFTILKTNKDGSYQVKKNHFLYGIRGISRIHCYLVDSSLVYLGSENGLFIYEKPKHDSYYNFNTFISRIRINSDTSNYFENYTSLTKNLSPEVKYKNNKVNFLVTASDFYNVKLLEFSHYLEGKEDDYGPWNINNNITYSNLGEGTYTLHVKSKNILGVEGTPVNFTFTILPPWYRTYWAYTLYVLGSIGLIWFIVAYNTRRLKEQNIKLEEIITERTKEIEHQKAEIEHKNQEITDSINYAKRIQQAILPPVNDILRVWNDTFVFYQPKDIVSGDFYWFSKINDNEMLIACCDCTGHGVPGGFMSMICSDKLTDAVKLTHDPEKILFHTNNNVKKALRQTETSDENVNKDGMEISLVRINFKTSKIWYAGANRPLWILKKGGAEIEEVKPTKASIASFTQPDFEYQGHEIQLAKDDLVYMTSDGYPDQFGGPEGKKFMTKNFKKLLLSIKELGIRDQENTVKNVINQWKEGYEQVDDLLVIAFKL